MSSVAIQDLYGELSQEVTYELSERLHLGGIYPYLYAHNFTGSVKFSLIKGANEIFSQVINMDYFKSSLGSVNNYILCFLPVIPANPIQLEAGTYKLKLESIDYIHGASSFIAWCVQHEDVQNESTYLKLSNTENPLAFRVKVLKEGVL